MKIISKFIDYSLCGMYFDITNRHVNHVIKFFDGNIPIPLIEQNEIGVKPCLTSCWR